jgi:hypothetical protein
MNEIEMKQTAPMLFVAQKNKRRAVVQSVEDAAAKWVAYRSAELMNGGGGCSEIGNGGAVYVGSAIVARISYNGRIWVGESA